MCDALHINSLKQCPTPLNTLFFSEFNMNVLQRGIRQDFKNKSGVSIDYQNNNDLYSIMRVVFINNSGDPNTNVQEQVRWYCYKNSSESNPNWSFPIHGIHS